MDNLAGLSSNAPSYPSFPIKEQLLNVLESKEIELDALLKLLGVELKASHQLKTVHELVNNYEEQNGQISLETWESIFRGLGYSKDFLQVLANFNEKCHCQGTVDLAVANLHTGKDKKNDESGASSNGAAGSSSALSKKDPGAKPKTNPQFGSLSHDDTSSGLFAALSASVDAEIDTFDKKTAAYSLSSSLLVERPLTKNSSEEDNNGTVNLAVANLHAGEDKKNDESGASSNGAAGSSSALSKKDPGAKPKTNPQFGSLSHDDTSSGPFAVLSASVDAEIDTFDKKTAAYSLSSSLLVERPLTKNSSEEVNNDKVLKSKSEFESTNLRQQNALARGLTTPPQFPQTDNNKWPEWSLPPPEGHEREKKLSIHDDQDFGEQSRSAAVSTAKREDSFSCLADNSTLSESPTTDEMVQSPPERSASGTVSGETETPHNDIAAKMRQSCFEKQDCSTLMANQEKKENGHVSNNAALLATEGPLLTSSVDFVACSSSSENLNSQQSRIPAEQDDNVGDIGLLEEMSKEIASLHLYETFMTEENDILRHNEAYLLQELRIQKDQHRAVCYENLTLRRKVERSRTEKAGLLVRTQELQAQLNEKELEHRIVQETLRTENAELLEQKEELQDRLNEREFEIAEKNELIQSMLEENDRLRESVPVPIPEDDD